MIKSLREFLTIGTSIAAIGLIGGCSSETAGEPSSNRVDIEPAPVADVKPDPVVVEAPAASTIIAGPIMPGETIRGTAVPSGEVTIGGKAFGSVSDSDASAIQTYVPFSEVLEPGSYRFTALYSLDCGAGISCQTVIRVRPPASAEAFKITNAFVGSDYNAGAVVGSSDAFAVAADNGVGRLTLDFTVVPGDAGQYRVFLIPAAAQDGTYDKALTGTLSIADATLSRL